MAGHARLLDRRRFELLVGGGDPDAVLAAARRPTATPTAATAGAWSPTCGRRESQPGGALHAFEVFEDIAPRHVARAPSSCATGWTPSRCPTAGSRSRCRSPTRPAARRSGPTPTRRPRRCRSPRTSRPPPTASPPTTPPSPRTPGSPGPPDYCLDAIDAIDERALRARARGLAAVPRRRARQPTPRPPALLERLGAFLPPTGRSASRAAPRTRSIRPLDFAPYSRTVRSARCFDPEADRRRPANASSTSSRTTAAGASTSRATRPPPSSNGGGMRPCGRDR